MESDFSTATIEARRELNDISNMLRERTINLGKKTLQISENRYLQATKCYYLSKNKIITDGKSLRCKKT